MSIFENDSLKITSRQSISDNKSDTILLSFTGIGHGMGAIDVQKPEFFGTGRSFDNVIFVTDKTRSWGNQLDFGFITNSILPYVGGRKVYSIGNSMGGFNAILFTSYIPTSTCIAFAPQYSVAPSIVPWETRWKKYTSNIQQYQIASVENSFNTTTKYFIFSGRLGLDYNHARLFPVKENIYHYSFHNIAHNVSVVLKEHDVLDKAVQSCLNGSGELPIDLGYDRLSPSFSQNKLLH